MWPNWLDMSEDVSNLFAVFENCMQEVTISCNDKKRRIEVLEASLKEKDEIILQAEQTIAALKVNYTNLLTARRLADDKEAFQQARKRVNKLVREVDLCIALLNE